MTAPPTTGTGSVELIAILRGLSPERASEVGAVIFAAGFRTIEMPLNSPVPFETIHLLANEFGASARRCRRCADG